MRKVFVAGDNIITSLGFTTEENMANLRDNVIGLKITNDNALSPVPVPLSLIDTSSIDHHFSSLLKEKGWDQDPGEYTR